MQNVPRGACHCITKVTAYTIRPYHTSFIDHTDHTSAFTSHNCVSLSGYSEGDPHALHDTRNMKDHFGTKSMCVGFAFCQSCRCVVSPGCSPQVLDMRFEFEIRVAWPKGKLMIQLTVLYTFNTPTYVSISIWMAALCWPQALHQLTPFDQPICTLLNLINGMPDIDTLFRYSLAVCCAYVVIGPMMA